MSEVKDDVITKCKKCNKDLLMGQRFCAECGAEQNLAMRTVEEILEMKKRIFKLKGPSKDKMMMYLIVTMTVDISLSWVLGYRKDKDVLGMIQGELGKEGGDKA